MTLLEKARLVTPIVLFAIGFTDAVYGGIVRASEGLGVHGFIQSIFSGGAAVCAIMFLNTAADTHNRSVFWAVLAVALTGIGALVSPDTQNLMLGHSIWFIFAIALATFAVVLTARHRQRHSQPENFQ